jgi:predicted transcriptional regulator
MKKLTITSKDITSKQWSVLLLELNMIKKQWKKYANLEISTPGFSKIISWGKRRYDARY